MTVNANLALIWTTWMCPGEDDNLLTSLQISDGDAVIHDTNDSKTEFTLNDIHDINDQHC